MWTSLALAALACAAASLLAARLYPERRAERALATMVLATTVIHGSVHALGWLEVLTPSALAAAVVLASLGLTVGTLALSRPPPISVLGARVREMLVLPVSALREAWDARSATFPALLCTYAILAWSLFLAFLAPSGSWDGLWYHEPMAAFALQNHGFGVVELPVHLEWVNGYPRLSENLMLFASAFGDRTLIDAVPHPMAITAALAFFVLVQRYSRSRSESMGLACVLLTVPAVVLQLRSTYVDLSVLATFLAALHFATRSRFGARDAWLAACALGLLGGTKSTGLVYVGLIGAMGLVSVAGATRRGGGRVLAHAVPALVLALALFLPTFVRNQLLHENPIWPLRYHSDLLGLDLPGPHDIQNMQQPFGAVMAELFAVPEPGQDFADTRRHAFGFGLTYVGIPVLLVALARFARDWTHRRTTATGASVASLWLLFGVGLFTLLGSPAFYWARYSLPFPAVALVVIGAFLALRPRGISGEAVIFAMFLMNAVTLVWARPRWDVDVEAAYELWASEPSERPYAEVSPLLLSPTARRWREEHLGHGDVVAFDDEFAFIAGLWTEDLGNTVIWVPYHGRADYLDALDAADVVWVVVRDPSPESSALASDPRWHYQETCVNEFRLYERVGRFDTTIGVTAPEVEPIIEVVPVPDPAPAELPLAPTE